MNCNCIKNIETKVKERGYDGKVIEEASFLSAGLVMAEGRFQTITTSEIELKLTGQKKAKTITMVHTFCPFCGKEAVAKKKAKKEPVTE